MNDHLSDVFRANVRAMLQLSGKTQYRLATDLGVHHTWVQKLLANPRGGGLTLATVERVSNALGMDVPTMLTPGGVQRSRVIELERAS